MPTDITETRQKIKDILAEDFAGFTGGFFVIVTLIGVIEKIMKAGEAKRVYREIEPDLRKIRKALETDTGMRTDPLVEKLLRLTKGMMEGDIDPRIKDVIAAVKQKYANPSLPDHLRANGLSEADIVKFPKRRKDTPVDAVHRAVFGHAMEDDEQEPSYRHGISVRRTVDGFQIFHGDQPHMDAFDDPEAAHREAGLLQDDLDEDGE